MGTGERNACDGLASHPGGSMATETGVNRRDDGPPGLCAHFTFTIMACDACVMLAMD